MRRHARESTRLNAVNPMSEVFTDARPGERIFFDDGKIAGVIRAARSRWRWISLRRPHAHERSPDQEIRPHAQAQCGGDCLEIESRGIPRQDGPTVRRGCSQDLYRVSDMKSTPRRRRSGTGPPRSDGGLRNEASQQASYRRKLERLLKQMLAGEIPLGSTTEIRASPRFPYRRIIE